MFRVWVDDKPVGRISRYGTSDKGMTFSYDRGVDPKYAVSLSMPPRAASYDAKIGLIPIFDMNLPEGDLRERIHNVLAKNIGTVTDLDILGLTGSHQIGRVRVLPEGVTPTRRPQIGSLEDLLTRDVTPSVIEGIMSRFALDSGVSGAMPKVLAEDSLKGFDPHQSRITAQTRDWILKFGEGEYPGLPIVEHYCLEVFRLAGFETVEAHLSRDGNMLAVRRFDEVDGRRIGFEDLATLNTKVSKEKYNGSIETGLFKKVKEFSDPASRRKNLQDLFALTAANIMMRNGDAHLKNFGLLYGDISGPIKLSPAYDIVTTKAWIKDDMMALTLDGKKTWPKMDRFKGLFHRAVLKPSSATRIIEKISDAMREVAPSMEARLIEAGYPDVAESVLSCWDEGLVDFGLNPLGSPDVDHDEYTLRHEGCSSSYEIEYGEDTLSSGPT